MKASRLLIFIGILSSTLFSCGAEKKEIVIPENIIQKEEFSSILVEMLIIEGYRTRVTRSNAKKDSEMRSFYLGAFEKHGITKAQFEESYAFYRNHPVLLEELTRNAEKEFKGIEDEVVNERNQKGIKKEENKTPRKKLSIPGTE